MGPRPRLVARTPETTWTWLDSTTSSRHAVIHFDVARGVVFIEDLGSTNGTFVNDVPIGHNGRRELRDNDRVRFGGFSALLKLLPLI